jgi:hypothetical protein
VLALGLELDGSLRLQARPGRVATTLLRLRVKLCDAMWWRARRADDVWDFGYLVDTKALATFTPRRATLVVVEGNDAARLRAAVDVLQALGPSLRRPLRLLLLTGVRLDGVEEIELP